MDAPWRNSKGFETEIHEETTGEFLGETLAEIPEKKSEETSGRRIHGWISAEILKFIYRVDHREIFTRSLRGNPKEIKKMFWKKSRRHFWLTSGNSYRAEYFRLDLRMKFPLIFLNSEPIHGIPQILLLRRSHGEISVRRKKCERTSGKLWNKFPLEIF